MFTATPYAYTLAQKIDFRPHYFNQSVSMLITESWFAAEAGGTDCAKMDLAGPVAFVLGSEGRGVRRLVREACDGTVSVPMLGAVSSLNVSVAAAVLAYEARRQRG